MAAKGEYVRGRCPECGQNAKRRVYDIGSGPEISCSTCEWCWGVDGQSLEPLDIEAMKHMAAEAKAQFNS